MIGRRPFLVLAAVPAPALAAPALTAAVPAGHALEFRIIRKGSAIGTHRLAFGASGQNLTVRIEVAIAVTLGPVTLYRYGHTNTETWEGDSFTGCESQTNHNGTKSWMRARRLPQGLLVEGSEAPRYTAPANAIGTTYWNPLTLKVPLFDSENGKLLKTTIADRGADTVADAAGAHLPAHHYAVSGDLVADIWYDSAFRLVSLGFVGSDGSTITYQKL